METIVEKLYRENEPIFEVVKAKMTEQVMNDIRKYGHHRIYFHNKKDIGLVRLERYPDGSDCTEIHHLLVRHAEKYLEEKGFRVYVDYYSNESPKCIDVSL